MGIGCVSPVESPVLWRELIASGVGPGRFHGGGADPTARGLSALRRRGRILGAPQ
ncbi:hypothetical protein Dimus_022270, partial [Dionaea muscipula]